MYSSKMYSCKFLLTGLYKQQKKLRATGEKKRIHSVVKLLTSTHVIFDIFYYTRIFRYTRARGHVTSDSRHLTVTWEHATEHPLSSIQTCPVIFTENSGVACPSNTPDYYPGMPPPQCPGTLKLLVK